jgi:antitoxin CcdA
LSAGMNHPQSRTRAVIDVRSDLLAQAEALGINLSRTLEDRLEEAIKEAARQQWVAENRDAIQSFNNHLERHGGSIADDYRTF